MMKSQQITPGMTLSLNEKLYRVESSLKVSPTKGAPFIKVQMQDLATDQWEERNFKVGQEVLVVSLEEKKIEFLYPEGQGYLFLDIGTLDTLLIPSSIVGEKSQYLKEGIELETQMYGTSVFSIILPQFLELMVAKVQASNQSDTSTQSTKTAVLETGAKVKVPLFVEVGDVIKVDTQSHEFVQRM